jgi:hypothetical protein
MRFFWFVQGLVFSVGMGVGHAADRWDLVSVFAYQLFDNSVGMSHREWNYRQMMGMLYAQSPDVRLVFVDARADGLDDGTSWTNAFHTVHEALDALDQEGGWIWVAEGTYHESLRLPSKTALFGGFAGLEQTLFDRDPAGHPTVLAGDGFQSVVFMEHQTILDGFVITGGGGDQGAGVCTGGWLSIVRNNVLTGNHSGWSGGGLLVIGGEPADGSVGKVDGFAPVIERNVIVRNTALCGSGAAIRHTRAFFLNNTVVGNNGDLRARGLEVVCRIGEEPTVLHSIFWENGDEIYHQVGMPGRAILMNDCIQDDEDYGNGVIHTDPVFADTLAGDYSLKPGSPCINAGLLYQFLDPDGTPADLGALCSFRHGNDTGGAVTIQSEPITGVPVNVEGKFYSTPFTVSWYPGYWHSFGAVQFVRLDAGTAYVFDGWNDGAERIREIQAPSTALTFTASYKRQFLLEICDKPQGVTVQGEGWHDPNSVVAVSAAPIMDMGNGVRYLFKGWEGIGPGTYTGIQPWFQVTLSRPMQERMKTETEYLLTTRVYPEGATGIGIDAQPPGPWLPADASVVLSAVSRNPYYKFSSWYDRGWKTEPQIAFPMDGPRTVEVFFDYMPHPPLVVHAFADTAMDEDGSIVFSRDWLLSHVKDSVDAIQVLRPSLSTEASMRVEADSAAGLFRVMPVQDWYGSARIVFSVTDPSGATDRDTFFVTVAPVPDPPGPFHLIAPETGVKVTPGPVRFAWAASVDPDPGDTVTYRFVLGTKEHDPAVDAALDTVLAGTSLSVRLESAGTLFWNVHAVDRQGHVRRSEEVFRVDLVSGVDTPVSRLPQQFAVSDAFPNPFNPETGFDLELPEPVRIRATVFDVRGRGLRTLVDGLWGAGMHRIVWDGKDGAGAAAPSGVYAVRIELGGRLFVRKTLLAR